MDPFKFWSISLILCEHIPQQLYSYHAKAILILIIFIWLKKTKYYLFIKYEDHISEYGVFFLKDETQELKLIFGGTFSFKEDLILNNIILYVPEKCCQIACLIWYYWEKRYFGFLIGKQYNCIKLLAFFLHLISQRGHFFN